MTDNGPPISNLQFPISGPITLAERLIGQGAGAMLEAAR